MDGFRIASAYVEVDADTSKADAKIDALIAKLGALSGDTATARIRVDGADEAAAASREGPGRARRDPRQPGHRPRPGRHHGRGPGVAGGHVRGARPVRSASPRWARLKVPLFGGECVFGLSLPVHPGCTPAACTCSRTRSSRPLPSSSRPLSLWRPSASQPCRPSRPSCAHEGPVHGRRRHRPVHLPADRRLRQAGRMP